jgi:hypothetical protein
VWTAAGQHEPREGNGGMLRSIPLFAANAKKRRNTHGDCTKHQYGSGALKPGILVCCGVSHPLLGHLSSSVATSGAQVLG